MAGPMISSPFVGLPASLALCACSGVLAQQPLVLHVAPDGSDTAPGTEARPFATLERARDELRVRRPEAGAVVQVREGDYLLAAAFELTEADSAPEGARIVYRARGGETVRLIGGVQVTDFRPYKGEVLQADVAPLGLADIPPVSYSRYSGNTPGFELFFRGERMSLARWPNRVPGHPRWGEWALIPKTTEKTRMWFHYAGDRPSRWARPQEAQVHWFPWYNYMDQYVGVKSVDTAAKAIHLSAPAVYEVQPGRRYYVQNVFEELDAPGEWYLDREKSILYFWPPAPIAEGKVVASRIDTVVRLEGASRVTLRGFTVESCRGDAVVVSGGSGNTVAGCVVRSAFRDGIVITGGTDNGAVGNDIYDVGRRGILLSGGDRDNLLPARNHATNNHIHHMSRLLYTYAPGVQVNGCGNIVRHNLIHDGPHMAMGLAGNDHLIEYNEIHHVMHISSHGGAFYCGRDFTARGNVIRFNKLHDITGYGFDHVDNTKGVFVYASPVRSLPGAFGLHLDDQISGFHIHGNLFYRVAHGVIRNGGGRDTVVENNVFADCGWSVHVDNRGLGWQKRATQGGTLMKRLLAIDYKDPPWSERYPELVDILEDRFCEPVDNVVRRNVFSQRGTLYNFSRVPSDRFTVDHNLVWRGGEPVVVTGRTYKPNAGGVIPFADWKKMGYDAHSVVGDPLFVDAANDDYRLRSESPALKLGFEPIPIETMGLYHDDLRASPPPPPDPRKASSEQVIEEFPIPGHVAVGRKTVEVTVPQAGKEIVVDGTIRPGEWWGADRRKAWAMATDYSGEPVVHKSYAWVTHDGESLYVAVSSDVDPGKPLSGTNQWGRDDAVELALQDVTGDEPGPIHVLRGYPSGHVEASPEAGAPADAVLKARAAVRFAARHVSPGRWDAEWCLPLRALDIEPPRPAREPRLRLNVTVRKAATNEWVMWLATGGNSWRVDNAGVITLVVPGGG